MKAQSRNDLVAAILMTVLGVLFLILKGGVISIAMTVFGVFLFVQAILDIIAKQYVMAVVKAVIGVVVILLGWLLIDIAIIIFAIILAIFGVLQLIEAIKAFPQIKNMLGKVLVFVKPVVCIVISVCLFVNAGGVIDVMFIIAGVFFIVQGVISLISCLATRK